MSKLEPVLRCLPFTVDTWTADSCHKHQFLTHAHKDHLAGISQHGRHIVCTDITRQLVLLKVSSLKDAEASAAVEFTVLEPYVQHSFEVVGMPGVNHNANTHAWSCRIQKRQVCAGRQGD
jgi:mRNA degradation ribonuclease J1/J2